MEELTEEQRQLNEEHLRLAEQNKNAEYVDLWKRTKQEQEAKTKENKKAKLGGK